MTVIADLITHAELAALLGGLREVNDVRRLMEEAGGLADAPNRSRFTASARTRGPAELGLEIAPESVEVSAREAPALEELTA